MTKIYAKDVDVLKKDSKPLTGLKPGSGGPFGAVTTSLQSGDLDGREPSRGRPGNTDPDFVFVHVLVNVNVYVYETRLRGASRDRRIPSFL